MTQVTYTDEGGSLRCSGCGSPWEPAHICPAGTSGDDGEAVGFSVVYSSSTDERIAMALERIAAVLEKLADEYASEAQEKER